MAKKRLDSTLTTTQVARILGVTPKTLYRMLKDGRVTEPARNPDNNYRQWSPYEIQRLQEELSR
ncbi:MAG: helix-turn-helix domain-containing protein [Paludibaculum sp.]